MLKSEHNDGVICVSPYFAIIVILKKFNFWPKIGDVHV